MKYPNHVVRQGEKDPAVVTAVQKRLMELGTDSFTTFGVYGPKTVAAVKFFQSTHRDQVGNPLEIDGKLGSISWASLFRTEDVPITTASAKDLLTEAIKTARSQVGVMEKPPGSNTGPEVNEYLRSVGCAPGSFWCAAFVYWCFDEAAKKLTKRNPLFKTGSCLTHWNNTNGKKIESKKAVENPSLVKPGQIFIIDHGGGKGHTGIVEKVEGGFIHTIEGNSNTDGSSNGIGVFALTRKIIKINKGFIEY